MKKSDILFLMGIFGLIISIICYSSSFIISNNDQSPDYEQVPSKCYLEGKSYLKNEICVKDIRITKIQDIFAIIGFLIGFFSVPLIFYSNYFMID